ncbi:MAG: hypothetical protein HYX69_17450 [Planctomycetia bacterium]|nr:hypothetical protein [Planctomycetia bacterium]
MPDCLLWRNRPATPGENESQQALREFENFAAANGSALVIGCDRKTGDDGSARRCNSAAVVDPARGCIGFYDKMWLVPFSEFHPPGRPAFGRMAMDRYAHGTELPVFTIEVGAPRRAYRFASAICYDTCFPESFRSYMRPAAGGEAPQFFVVPACESHDRGMRLQKVLLRLAQFRAIETRRAFVRNAEGGYSGIIDGNGTLVAGPPRIDFAEPCVIGRVPLDERASPYTRWGDWLPIACTGTLLVSFAASLVRRGGG